MIQKTENFQAQFSGFFNTPHLFKSEILGMQPFIKTLQNSFVFNAEIKSNIRLGQRVERFVAAELKQFSDIEILAENLQIQRIKQTVGEIDCLFLNDGKPVHLEIQFKYYLYDVSLGITEIDHCIGPMRRDSLNQKLEKLKNQQLPLLYGNDTKPYLDNLNFKAEDFTQHIYFKAQIFVPYGQDIEFNTLNNDCIYGFYFKYKDLLTFKDCKFYKPKKTDWLLDINPNVGWQTYDEILPQLNIYETENYSPLLWLKFKNGEITKCFVVSW